MTRVEQLEKSIMALDRSELSALREWFQSYIGDEWDQQIEADAKAGKLDKLADRALAEYQAGPAKRLGTATPRPVS